MGKPKRKTKRQPSLPELRNAIPTIYREMAALFTWYISWTRCRSAFEVLDQNNPEEKSTKTVVLDAVAIASIMNVRKMAEFFKTRPEKNDERDDDLRAYDFPNFAGTGDTLLSEDLTEMHKRVAHMTFREAQTARAGYELMQAANLIMPRCVSFLAYLEQEFFAQEAEAQSEIRKFRSTLTMMHKNWQSLAEPLDRL